ncbi:MAG TPA: cysteine hydrolase [Ohtaekwangia sp.]|nr:cysteine hydrolase [Ohtaekwangia sp.]
MFDRAGINISEIQKTIEPIGNVIAAARKSGIKIIYLKMGFKPDLSDVGREEYHKRLRPTRKINVGDSFTSPTGSQGRILVRDTWNTDIISQLQPQTDDIVIYKTRFSGFYQTPLDSILKNLEKKYLIFTGATTSICVESTVRDAAFRDYVPIVLEDCTAEPIGNNLARSNHEASLLNIQLSFGWVSNSKEFTKAITRPD